MCAQATDLARAAVADQAGPDQVGPHLGRQADGDRVVTHLFESLQPGYRGWRWAVTVTRASRAKLVTVSELVLLPGPDALLAPEWVPWRDRLRPGDLGVGDLLPASADDERLVPVVTGEGDGLLQLSGGDEDTGEAAAPHQIRVLSAIGRDETAERWYSGDHGPHTPLTRAAPAHCVSCGFLIRLAGPLGSVFGVCGNAYAPEDGRVVSVDHGCGAHSEGAQTGGSEPVMPPIIDELGYDLVDMPGVSVDETVFESLDHD
ncbi:MAG TPA: DUF3027 domain-containing protein [Streptosporangiaceae bacterium]|jgi:hypothetical protein